MYIWIANPSRWLAFMTRNQSMLNMSHLHRSNSLKWNSYIIAFRTRVVTQNQFIRPAHRQPRIWISPKLHSMVIADRKPIRNSCVLCHIFFTELVAKCKWYEAWENEYKKFHKLSDIKDSQPDGYLVKLPLYVHGSRDAHILLSATDKPNWETDNVYEIGEYYAGYSNAVRNFGDYAAAHMVLLDFMKKIVYCSCWCSEEYRTIGS